MKYKSEFNLTWDTYPQVVKVCKDIISNIKKGNKNITVFMPFQSGKSAVIQCLAELLCARGPNRLVYFCAYDRKTYKSQIVNDLQIFEKTECRILVGKDIEAYKPQVHDIVVIDEAGYGVSKNQRLERALTAVNGITIAVSATPYEALKSSWSKATCFPSQYSLRKYYGVWDMIKVNKIHEAKECIEKQDKRYGGLTSWFQDKLDNMDTNSYGIVRAKNSTEAYALKKRIEKQGIKCELWTQNNQLNQPIKDVLNIMPRKKTVYIVVNHLRMGERIVDRYLDFVIDRLPKTKAMNNTVTQSLVGRCCGWDKTPGKVNIYTSTAETYAYASMWKEVWEHKTTNNMLKRRNACKNFKGSAGIKKAVNSNLRIINGYRSLPKIIRDNIEWKYISSKGGKHKARKSYRAVPGNGVVQTKSYFGVRKVGERNKRELVECLESIKHNKPFTKFNQFADRQKGRNNITPYALFCIQTNELQKEYNVKKGDFVLLTKSSNEYKIEYDNVVLKEGLFTSLTGGTSG